MNHRPAPRPRTHRPRRAGLTLLEVLLSLAIFLFAIVALLRLVTNATQRAAYAERKQQATYLCQSKLNEFAAGVLPLASQGATPFDEDADWQWSADAGQDDVSNLWRIQVTVSRQMGDGSELSVALTRMILDPSVRGSTANTVKSLTSANSTTSPSSSGGTTP